MKKIRILFFLLCIIPTLSFAVEMEDYEVAKLGALNKITGKTSVLKINVGEKSIFGDLDINVLACQKSSPLEAPESASYIKINNTGKQLFSGWMFASSPALSAMENGIYDIWIIDCEKKLEK